MRGFGYPILRFIPLFPLGMTAGESARHMHDACYSFFLSFSSSFFLFFCEANALEGKSECALSCLGPRGRSRSINNSPPPPPKKPCQTKTAVFSSLLLLPTRINERAIEHWEFVATSIGVACEVGHGEAMRSWSGRWAAIKFRCCPQRKQEGEPACMDHACTSPAGISSLLNVDW